MVKIWTKLEVREKLHEISAKGFLSIPKSMFRTDDGIVGQILERKFGIKENNLPLRDLGTYELKGLRSKSKKLTLFHITTKSGMKPIEIFNQYGYIKPSKRTGILKKKLFSTIKLNKENNRGFILKLTKNNELRLYNKKKYLATWDLSEAKKKIEKVILVFADTKGITNNPKEKFHYTEGYILSGLKLEEALSAGYIVMDFAIDQPVDKPKVHDRGPHIRIYVNKNKLNLLHRLYNSVEKIL